jgi:hemolysin III
MNDVVAVSAPSGQLYDSRRAIHYDKPRLRGWLHLVSFGVFLVLGTLLIVTAQGSRQVSVASVYAAPVTGMFGASALYHRGHWETRTLAWLQRLDHLMIFLVIAGTATPPIVICLPDPYSAIGLIAIWTLTLLAAGTRMTRMRLPEWLAGSIFIGLGWAAGIGMPAVWIHAGVGPPILLLIGGVLYTVGALAYHRRWPDPRPATFGYHEVFHLFVSVAAACQFIAIAFLL